MPAAWLVRIDTLNHKPERLKLLLPQLGGCEDQSCFLVCSKQAPDIRHLLRTIYLKLQYCDPSHLWIKLPWGNLAFILKNQPLRVTVVWAKAPTLKHDVHKDAETQTLPKLGPRTWFYSYITWVFSRKPKSFDVFGHLKLLPASPCAGINTLPFAFCLHKSSLQPITWLLLHISKHSQPQNENLQGKSVPTVNSVFFLLWYTQGYK